MRGQEHRATILSVLSDQAIDKGNSVKVEVHNETILEGMTYDPIDIDDCTYTLQNVKNQSSTNISNEATVSNEQQQRELCITMGKVENGRTWMYIVK